MDIRNYEDRLITILQEPLKKYGFWEKERLLFVRGNSDITETLAFGGRLDIGSDRFLFGCTVGIKFLAVEKIYRPEMLNEIIPTIMLPLHLLHKDRAFFEWSIDENEIDISIKKKVMQEVEIYALPFYERFVDLNNVKDNLKSSNPKNWFVLTPEQRICILGIIEYLRGDLERATKIIDKAIEERKGAFPKKLKLLEKIRERLRVSPLDKGKT
jgi:hypothetical protein